MAIQVGRGAAKYFDRLDTKIQERIVQALEGLEKYPPVGDIKKIKGETQPT